MAITTAQVAVTTGGTIIALGAGAGDNKMQVTVRHVSATATVIGGAQAVTAGDGFTLAQSVSETFVLKQGDVLWGKSSAGTVTVNVIQVW